MKPNPRFTGQIWVRQRLLLLVVYRKLVDRFGERGALVDSPASLTHGPTPAHAFGETVLKDVHFPK